MSTKTITAFAIILKCAVPITDLEEDRQPPPDTAGLRQEYRAMAKDRQRYRAEDGDLVADGVAP
jgi:hypothetical protein